MMFLPPSPPQAPSPTPALAHTEPAVPALYSKASPNLLAALRPVAIILPPTDGRVDRAEARFQAGKKLYQQGDLDGARREFDRAVDLLLAASAQSNADRRTVDRKMDDLIAAIYRYDIDGLGSGEKSEQPIFDKAPLEDVLDLTFPVDPQLKPRVKDEVLSTASQLPLQVNDSVLGYINFFNSERGRRTLIAGLKRAGKYRPMISRILAEEGVPQELIYLAQAESGFLPRVVSRAAASGMWQFVRERGNQYGLKQSAYFDDRYDPEKATRAAARHLKDLYQQFGDWHLAIAAYNCGPGCVDRAVQRTGYADYWQLRARRAVPLETTNYVPIILAMTIMAKNAADYGIDNIEAEPPLEYENITLTSAVNLGLIADLCDRPVSELRDLNPSLFGVIAPAGYELHVPKGMQSNVMTALQAIPEGRRTSVRAKRASAADGSVLAAKASTNTGDATIPGGFQLVAGTVADDPDVTVRARTTPQAKYVRVRTKRGYTWMRATAPAPSSSYAAKTTPPAKGRYGKLTARPTASTTAAAPARSTTATRQRASTSKPYLTASVRRTR